MCLREHPAHSLPALDHVPGGMSQGQEELQQEEELQQGATIGETRAKLQILLCLRCVGELCVTAYGMMLFSEPHADIFNAMHGAILVPGVNTAPASIEAAAVGLLPWLMRCPLTYVTLNLLNAAFMKFCSCLRCLQYQPLELESLTRAVVKRVNVL